MQKYGNRKDISTLSERCFRLNAGCGEQVGDLRYPTA